MQLQHLQHNAIDYKLWDEKIEASMGHLPYAQTWFLDIVSPGWEAIVSNDYEYIMPLPVKKKFKIGYLVQPVFTQQLGIFSNKPTTAEIVDKFRAKIPYLSYQLNLNENNETTDAVLLANLVLSLVDNYAEIVKNYSKNNIRNIEKANKYELIVAEIEHYADVIHFLEKCSDCQSIKLCDLIRGLLKKGYENHKLMCWGARNKAGELVAAVCFLKSQTRLVYLLPVSNEEAKRTSAMFAIVDKVIQKFAGSGMTFDFEGSRIQGIARFYKGFGALNQPYFMIKKNRPKFLTGRI